LTLNVSPGESLKRREERRAFEALLHEPPRSTRVDPLEGPGGFVDGLEA
jgi:hypothetical protein